MPTLPYKPLFNHHLLALRQARALRQNIAGADFLLVHAINELIDRLATVNRDFSDKIALFGGTEMLQSRLSETGKRGKTRRIERHFNERSQSNLNETPGELDKESADLIVSTFGLHWCNDLPGKVHNIRTALRPDGLFMAVLPGPGTLHELRDCLITAESNQATGVGLRVDPFTDMRDAGTLLQQAGFALPVVDVESLTVRYSSARALMHDLRHMGAGCVLNEVRRTGLTRTILDDMEAIYRQKYSDPDGRLRATFSLVFLSGWAPHPDQQKPLKPGSAEMRLADVLNR